MKKLFFTLALMAALLPGKALAEVDPNFYIYLCLGQSNMDGQAEPETVDANVDARFQTLACTNFSRPARTMGQWYKADVPIVRENTKLGVTDYFGRTMVAALPQNVKVGVVAVAVSGVAIEGFMQEEVADYVASAPDWQKSIFAAYNNDPYKRLVDMAKIAQQSGVIKGIVLHQGESNNGQQAWLQKVKTVYDRLLSDLNLSATDVPLFAGETVNADMNGGCAAHNAIIAQLPDVIPTAHVIPSNGCPCADDMVHFTAEGYRTMGKRYAYEALRVLGKEAQAATGYAWTDALRNVYSIDHLEDAEDVSIRIGGSKRLTVWGVFKDGHRENLSHEIVFTGNGFNIVDGVLLGTESKSGTVTATYTDFLGATKSIGINVEVSNNADNHILAVNNGTAGQNYWDKELITRLSRPLTIGKSYTIKATIKAVNGGPLILWAVWDASSNKNEWGGSNDLQTLENYNLTANATEYQWTFTARYAIDMLQFGFGQIEGMVYFDDVSCKEQGGDEEFVVNGSFESDDLSKWEVLSWAGQTMSIITDDTSGIKPILAEQMTDSAIYTLQGVKIADSTEIGKLPHGLYIVKGKTIMVK